MGMSSTSDRGPQPDEPQIPYYVISSCCSKAAGSRKLHIPAAGGTTPICEAETRDQRGEWDTKQIETRPPSWREGRWCEKCRERWDNGENAVATEGLVDGERVASTRVSEELRERVDAYAERMGLTRGEIVRRALRYMLMPAEEKAWEDDELLDALQNYKDEFGQAPTKPQLDKTEGYPSGSTYENRFGSLAAAREKAGVGHPDGSSGGMQATIRAYEYLRANPDAAIDEVMREADVGQLKARSVATHMSRRWD